MLLVAVVVLAFVAGYAAHGHVAPRTSSLEGPSSHLTVPVLRESFTLLKCDRATTIGLEGCAEHAILQSDASINHRRRQYFSSLRDDASRRDFVIAETSWQHFRQATCTSVSDAYRGGSLAPVAFANCVASLNHAHLVDLQQLIATPS